MRRAISLLWAFVLPVAFFFAVAEGPLSLGGGEKDIVLAVPLALFAVLNTLVGIVCWAHGVPPGRSAWRSLWGAIGILMVIWAGLAAYMLAGH
jgi:hypothetical protein